MATTPVTVYGDFGGMTSPTLMLYPLGSGGAVNGSGDALTANAAGATAWDAEVTEALEGVHRYEVVSGSVVVAFGFLPMRDTTTRVHGVDNPRVIADIQSIAGDDSSALSLQQSTAVILRGSVHAAALAPSTTEFASDVIVTGDADHYQGRLILFTLGDLFGQACTIDAFEVSEGNGIFTVSALTSAPSDDDTFIIV